jgi:hypothetical protein
VTWELATSGSLAPQALSAVFRAPGAAHAASASQLWLLVLLAVLVAAGRWGWHAWRHPYGPCWSCRGSGRNRGSTGKRHGQCKRCGGTGRRLRTGARPLHKALGRKPRR